MKKIFLPAIILVIALNACSENERSEKNTQVNETEVLAAEKEDLFLGESFDLQEEMDLANLISKMDSSDSLEAVVEAKVTEVCQAKGCWMKVDLPNGESMRVTFKDYAFFMPKDLAGKSVKMIGIARKEETNVESLRHFAEDAGQSKEEIALITDPEMDYKFVAFGVKLMD